MLFDVYTPIGENNYKNCKFISVNTKNGVLDNAQPTAYLVAIVYRHFEVRFAVPNLLATDVVDSVSCRGIF